jgi:hypothetical protein
MLMSLPPENNKGCFCHNWGIKRGRKRSHEQVEDGSSSKGDKNSPPNYGRLVTSRLLTVGSTVGS